jgi:PAS domain-containing protein
MAGRRRSSQGATRRTFALAAENERLQRELGWTGDEVRGRKFWDVFIVRKEAADFRRRLIGEDGVEHESAFYTRTGRAQSSRGRARRSRARTAIRRSSSPEST